MRRQGTRRQNRGGFILVTTVGIVTFFTLTGGSMMLRGLWQAYASARIYHRSNALHLAEAAAEQAARNLRTASTADDLMTATLASGSFTIDAQQNMGGQLYQVTTHGTSDLEQRNLQVVYRLIPQSIFQFALFGDNQLNVSGNAITDSYDSTLGPYNSDPGPSHNAGHNGDVGTNASTAGGVTVGGSIFVDGQVAVGSNASNPVSVVTGYDPLFITGGTDPPSDTQDVIAQTTAFPMPAVTVPVGVSCSNLTVSSQTTQTLSPTGGPTGNGVYCYHNLTLQGGGTLTASGPVKVYITGQFTARGDSQFGVVSDPKQMLMLMTSTGDATLEQGTITGSTTFYGALYGPSSTIDIQGNAEVFGSIVAQTVNVTGSAAIHYDETLSDTTNVFNTFKTVRLAWREL